MPSVSLRNAPAWITALALVFLAVGICAAQEDPAAEELPAASDSAKGGDDLDKLMNMDLDQLVNVEVSGIAPATLGDYPTESEAELPPGLVVPPVDRRTPAFGHQNRLRPDLGLGRTRSERAVRHLCAER